MEILDSFDRILMGALNRGAANPLFDWLMPRITNLHQQMLFLVVTLAVAVMILWRGPGRAKVGVICALLAVGVSDVTAARLVKKLVSRERPCYAAVHGAPLDPLVRLVPGTHCPGSRSFPSNHASNMAALAVVGFWFTRGRIRWLWLALPLLIGYSRVYLGFHYPTDVIGGWLIGALIATGVLALTGQFRKRPAPAEPSDPAGSQSRAPNA